MSVIDEVRARRPDRLIQEAVTAFCCGDHAAALSALDEAAVRLRCLCCADLSSCRQIAVDGFMTRLQLVDGVALHKAAKLIRNSFPTHLH
jgi:hypothetical protein